MKRLLLAYDGSPGADAAIQDLQLAGLPADLEVRVLAVADVWMPPENLAVNTGSVAARKAHEQARGAVQVAREVAENGADQLRALFPGWSVSAQACGDSPAWAVLAESSRWPADLVVVGSHGRTVLERIFLGSISQKVLAEARCSVRIARAAGKPATAPRCLVAVDGSADSEAAVRMIAARQWPVSAQFRVVTVVDPRLESAVVWPGVYAEQWVQQRTDETREWISRVTVHHVEILLAAGLSAEMDVFDGDPKKVLLREAEAWKATSLFLGARGLHHGDRHLLGTTASAVATRAHCSVELVRPA
jgi:nucleotide-binding universal stress UspA family protein